MIEKIRNLINEKSYKEALQLIEGRLNKSFNFSLDEEAKQYAELLSLRITCKTLSGETDDQELQEKYRSFSFPQPQSIASAGLHRHLYYIPEQNPLLTKKDCCNTPTQVPGLHTKYKNNFLIAIAWLIL